jgi:protein-S-isoprenylcysteine O-methyltransferase Ste14
VSNEPADAAGVLLFPPLLPLATLIVAGVLQRLYPMGLFARLVSPWRFGPGIGLLLAGVAITAGAGRALARAGTAVRPSQPSVALLATGVFRWTRNPMYVGGSLAVLGAAFVLRVDWLPLALLLSLPVLHFGIVAPEEAYLERKFGEHYRRYKEARVPRYLGLP